MGIFFEAVAGPLEVGLEGVEGPLGVGLEGMEDPLGVGLEGVEGPLGVGLGGVAPVLSDSVFILLFFSFFGGFGIADFGR